MAKNKTHRFIATDILPPGRAELMKANGIEFASLESAAEALMRIVSSRDVSGEWVVLAVRLFLLPGLFN